MPCDARCHDSILFTRAVRNPLAYLEGSPLIFRKL